MSPDYGDMPSRHDLPSRFGTQFQSALLKESQRHPCFRTLSKTNTRQLFSGSINHAGDAQGAMTLLPVLLHSHLFQAEHRVMKMMEPIVHLLAALEKYVCMFLLCCPMISFLDRVPACAFVLCVSPCHAMPGSSPL